MLLVQKAKGGRVCRAPHLPIVHPLLAPFIYFSQDTRLLCPLRGKDVPSSVSRGGNPPS